MLSVVAPFKPFCQSKLKLIICQFWFWHPITWGQRHLTELSVQYRSALCPLPFDRWCKKSFKNLWSSRYFKFSAKFCFSKKYIFIASWRFIYTCDLGVRFRAAKFHFKLKLHLHVRFQSTSSHFILTWQENTAPGHSA